MNSTIADSEGRPMLRCSSCGAPLTQDDFFDLGLRLPDLGESRNDYVDAELIDSVVHVRCIRSAKQAG